MLENRYLFYQKDIMLLNTLKNPREIDLNQSNIINSPINLITKYEIFAGLGESCSEIQSKLINFWDNKNTKIIYMMKLINILVYIKEIM